MTDSSGLAVRKPVLTIATLVVAIAAIAAAVVMYQRAERERHRNLVVAQTMVAWADDMAKEKKDLPQFLPLARESISLQRAALAGDDATFGGVLLQYTFMAAMSHLEFMSHPDVPAPLHDFETSNVNELADITLAMLAKSDDRALAFAMVFTENDMCDSEKNEKCARVVLEAAKLAVARVAAGNKDFEKVAGDLGNKLNSRAWDSVIAAGNTANVYERALVQSRTAAAAQPDSANVMNTLALAEYRSGNLEPAAAAIAKAIELRDKHKADSDDLAIKAMIDAKAGRADDARVSLRTIDERRAKATADAVAKGQKPPTFTGSVTDLMAEARAILK